MSQRPRIEAQQARGATIAAIAGSREGRDLRSPENDCEERRVQMVDDVEWMLETGEHPLRWADRVGAPSVSALHQMLRRSGRQDLAQHLDKLR